MRVLIVHGPNLNLLGTRDAAVYGSQTLDEINELVATYARDLGITVEFVQRNGEGELIDALHAAREGYDGIVLNPGAYAHYSYALADAIASIDVPVIEAHLSNTLAREEFRRRSVTAAACRGIVAGLGPFSYVAALFALAKNPGK